MPGELREFLKVRKCSTGKFVDYEFLDMGNINGKFKSVLRVDDIGILSEFTVPGDITDKTLRQRLAHDYKIFKQNGYELIFDHKK